VITLPKRSRGYQSDAARARYNKLLAAFCAAILAINSRLDFKVSSRGWCYILEDRGGLPKGDFDRAQALINACRKSGALPLDICADDSAREFDNLDWLDTNSPEEEARDIVRSLGTRHLLYSPFSFWEHQGCYVQMLVEKIDLKSLFGPICVGFFIPIGNARGWSDMNCRAAMMRRFAEWEAKGKVPVLLYCGDFDPVGLAISDFLRSNMAELAAAVGWSPDHLIIDRFGLNYDFIQEQGLTWIDGLETGSGKDLGDPEHVFNSRASVQAYIAKYGRRKVEANALVTRPEAGRDLCLQAILRYLPEEASDLYEARLQEPREQVRAAVARIVAEEFGG
jgi:hypothetical protein